jgi:hypothetical protein
MVLASTTMPRASVVFEVRRAARTRERAERCMPDKLVA